MKDGLSCGVCGEDRVPAFEFHHRDPAAKDVSLPKVVSRGWSTRRITAEVAKCALLGANCHRKLDAGLIAFPVSS